MSKEQMAEQIVNLAFDEDYGDGSLTFFDMCKSVAIRALELAEQSAEKRLQEATQHQERRIARQLTLLLAARDILTKCQNSPCVEDVMSVTAIWDDAECDGYCLLNEINDLITEKP